VAVVALRRRRGRHGRPEGFRVCWGSMGSIDRRLQSDPLSGMGWGWIGIGWVWGIELMREEKRIHGLEFSSLSSFQRNKSSDILFRRTSLPVGPSWTGLLQSPLSSLAGPSGFTTNSLESAKTTNTA
jgi:hypothetical protein